MKTVLTAALLLSFTLPASAELQSPWWFYDWGMKVVVGPFDKKDDCKKIASWSMVGGRSQSVSDCWQGSVRAEPAR